MAPLRALAKDLTLSLCFSAWAERRGYKTAKAARNDVYRAANSLLRLAIDGRVCLCLRPPGYSCLKGTTTHFRRSWRVKFLLDLTSFWGLFPANRALGKSSRPA